MKYKLTDNRGFTLLEMIMTVAVLGIFFGVVYGFLNFNLRFMNQRGGEQDYQLQGRIAMQRLENLLREYQSIKITGFDVQVDQDSPVNLVNFNQNTTNIAGYRYFFFWDSARGVGELRNGSGATVARGILSISFVDEPAEGVIRVAVKSVPPGNPADPGQTLSTRLRKGRSYNPL
ncbi:MAG: hypothetical protein VR68_15615 [Peptococcaceae bacterium BRH_c4a]|nr:MAG: hypothetical protein VR68_15615 [Peptococcaceae bacterium BRH_c4a]